MRNQLRQELRDHGVLNILSSIRLHRGSCPTNLISVWVMNRNQGSGHQTDVDAFEIEIDNVWRAIHWDESLEVGRH